MPDQRAERGSYVGCIAGALSFEEYEDGLRAAGFEDINITSTGETLPGLHNAIVRAAKGSGRSNEVRTSSRTALPVVQEPCC